MYVLLTLCACALGTVAKIVDAGHRCRLPRSLHWRAFDDHGMTVASFQLQGYVCLAAVPCAFLWYPLTLRLAKLV